MPESFLSMCLSPHVNYLAVYTAQRHSGRGHCYPISSEDHGDERAEPEKDSMQALAAVTHSPYKQDQSNTKKAIKIQIKVLFKSAKDLAGIENYCLRSQRTPESEGKAATSITSTWLDNYRQAVCPWVI